MFAKSVEIPNTALKAMKRNWRGQTLLGHLLEKGGNFLTIGLSACLRGHCVSSGFGLCTRLLRRLVRAARIHERVTHELRDDVDVIS